jgi:hypothetical protein
VFAAVTKYDEFIGCGGRDGEINGKKPGTAILIGGCPLAEHLHEGFVRFVLDRDRRLPLRDPLQAFRRVPATS